MNLHVIFLLIGYTLQGNFYQKFEPLAKEIIQHMTLYQKIGHTIQADFSQFNHRGNTTQYEQIQEYQLGSVLKGGNGCPDGKGNVKVSDDYSTAVMENWADVAQRAQQQAIKVSHPEGEITINLLLGTDAVHGNQHVLGAVLFPHNIGLAATHDPQNFANAAKWNKESIIESGFNFAFAPTVAVSHNPQWGRFYESMGENTTEIRQFAKAYVSSLQDADNGYLKGVLASTKHFLGDGATFWGIDQGIDKVYNMSNYINVNIQGYLGALESYTGNIMVSYSSVNEIRMSLNSELLQGLLKDENQFDGFLISDYNAIGAAAYGGLPSSRVKMELKQAYLMSLNAGMDMVMLEPRDDEEVKKYFEIVKELIKSGELRLSRIEDAVKRILQVKLAMQLVSVPQSLADKYGYENKQINIKQSRKQNSQDEYLDVLKAAQESLVLLKNDNKVIPLNKDKLKYLILTGEKGVQIEGQWTNLLSFDNIGMLNGGWSVRWQGFEGNKYWSGDFKTQSNASSILDGILNQINGIQGIAILKPEYSNATDWSKIAVERQAFIANLKNMNDLTAENTVIISVFGESPYAEVMGEINNPFCRGTTQSVEGCIYNNHMNEYMPLQQPSDLTLNLDWNSQLIIKTVQNKDPQIPVISVLISGRPRLVQETLDMSSAFISAWLPGTAGGQAIANAIFGDYLFRYRDQVNTLPVPWPKSMKDLEGFPVYTGQEQVKLRNYLYPTGYGLGT